MIFALWIVDLAAMSLSIRAVRKETPDARRSWREMPYLVSSRGVSDRWLGPREREDFLVVEVLGRELRWERSG